MNAHRAIEQTARDSYGSLIAYLTVRWRDLASVEDALADAFLTAIETWPHIGVPDKPEAWLLTAAGAKTVETRQRRIEKTIVMSREGRIQ